MLSFNVGLEVVRLLHEQGYQVKAAVRSHTGSSINLLSDVESVAFDFEQPQTFEKCIRWYKYLIFSQTTCHFTGEEIYLSRDRSSYGSRC